MTPETIKHTAQTAEYITRITTVGSELLLQISHKVPSLKCRSYGTSFSNTTGGFFQLQTCLDLQVTHYFLKSSELAVSLSVVLTGISTFLLVKKQRNKFLTPTVWITLTRITITWAALKVIAITLPNYDYYYWTSIRMRLLGTFSWIKMWRASSLSTAYKKIQW